MELGHLLVSVSSLTLHQASSKGDFCLGYLSDKMQFNLVGGTIDKHQETSRIVTSKRYALVFLTLRYTGGGHTGHP